MRRRRPACSAALAVLLLVLGQLAALAHNASTRHVRCAEHGEEQDAAQLAQPLHACSQDHLVGIEGDHGTDHDDCTIARALHQSAAAPHHAGAPQLVPTVADSALPREVALVAPATDLYRIAPKTSPPALV